MAQWQKKRLNNSSEYSNKVMINAKKEKYKNLFKLLMGKPLTYDLSEEVI